MSFADSCHGARMIALQQVLVPCFGGILRQNVFDSLRIGFMIAGLAGNVGFEFCQNVFGNFFTTIISGSSGFSVPGGFGSALFCPKGLRISAQGCCAAATLGRERTKIQPQRGCVKEAWENNDTTLSGLLA
uniref:Uncharacterized protein n=2 Tax=Candidatus Kentrum sp. TUN TaxID=2126343 RepID=A0A450ZT61_9GAMM|nr:MAG: hypothetical protein BECKTUN1418F_GA0071002_11008 [Candidatus Kentron sp. TUN]VFK64495.1 MAG: hypothetical protein BECKTUN1418E_GA0071001_10968 [Candidatus Kentron sp. TUN]